MILPNKPATHLQHTEELVVTADTTKGLEVSKSAEAQDNQPSTAEAEKVLDNTEKEVLKEPELFSLGHKDLTFDDLMTELEVKEKRGEDIYEGLYDTESEIKVIKKFQPSKVAIDAELTYAGNGSSTDSGLISMPDDDLVSITGFSDHFSEADSDETLKASADMPTHSNSLSHSHELGVLLSRIDQLEDNMSKKVSEELKSYIIQQTVKSSVSEAIEEEIPHVNAQALKNLNDQLLALKYGDISGITLLPKVLLKPMYKEFNAFNKLEASRFVILQNELSKFLHKNMRKSIRLRVRTGIKEVRDKLSACTSTVATNSQHVADLRQMMKDMCFLLEAAEGEHSSDQATTEVPPTVNAERSLVIHSSETNKDDSSDEDKDDVPLAKRFKIVILTTAIPTPIPLKSVLPISPKITDATKMTLAEFTDHLTNTTTSTFSPIPPRVPTPKHKNKGNGIATEEPLNQLVPFLEESGSAPKASSFKSFVTPGDKLFQDDIIAQAKEIKRLADLKAENERNKEALQRLLKNKASIQAQKEKNG
ncbi:hypothetical protein Tco_0873012 [Tanacetum coccineum]